MEEKEREFDRITCGRCNSSYFPRLSHASSKIDYSCPVCKFDGQMNEAKQNGPQILMD